MLYFFQGSKFRYEWRDSEVPYKILGSANRQGVHYMLVRLADKSKPLRDPSKDINAENVVVVRADDFRAKFPQLVIEYYQEHQKIFDDTDEDSDDGEGADPAKKNENDNDAKEHEIEAGNDVSVPATVTGAEASDQGKGSTAPLPMVPLDKFGLPVFSHCGESRRDIARFVPLDEIFDLENPRPESGSDNSDEDVEFLKDEEYRKILETESLGRRSGPSQKKSDES